MLNEELSLLFEDLADMEEIEGNRWESLAYRKVATSISLLSEDIREILRRGELRKVEGVGSATEKKIIEFLETGKIGKHEEMKKKYDIDFTSLRKIQGLGPKRIVTLYRTLGIKNVEDLSAAIESSKISSIQGFGKKSEEALRRSVEIYKQTGAGRKPLATVYDQIESILERMRGSGIYSRVELAGSGRRMKDTVGDIDILTTSSSPTDATDFFVSLEEVKHVLVSGDTKTSVFLVMGLNCDLRIVPDRSFGAALQYFTGSKEHNVKLRDMAISQGLKLNEYGLYKGDAAIADTTEEEIYSKLGLKWIPPELRENMGEIEASLSGKLPDLVPYGSVQGDFHTHTDATDGHSSLPDMISRATKMGHKFIAVTEHTKSLKVAGGMDEKEFRIRNSEIDTINESQDQISVLKGTEMEILKDGDLDLPYGLLEEMDVVIASLHQWVSDDIKENTARVVNALETGRVHILAHPTGRMIGTRAPYRLDFDKIFQTCEDHGVALEINGYPIRSDLPYDLVKKAREFKVDFALSSDAHDVSQLKYLRFATAIARRGWLTENRLINTKDWRRFIKK